MPEVYFATNRRYERRRGRYVFHDEPQEMGPAFFRCGKVDVTRDGRDYRLDADSVMLFEENLARQSKSTQERIQAIFDEPDQPPELQLRRAQEELAERPPPTQRLGSRELFSELRERMRDEGCDLLVFIHGYANSFADSVERAAELADQYLIDGRSPLVLAFSWPSNGRIFPPTEYHDDRDDAEASGKAIARTFLKLLDFLRRNRQRCERRLHVVAHSMGNWALIAAVQHLVEKGNRSRWPQFFEHAFLMAADVDDDSLARNDRLAPLIQLAGAVHVYHSLHDFVLRTSDTTKGNPNRLGETGPKTMDGLDDKVYAIDCRHVDETGFTDGNHQYYRARDEVIADVRAVLSGVAPEEVPDRERLASPNRFRIRRPE